MSFRGSVINPDRFHRSQIKFYLILMPVALFMLLPILYIINQAFNRFHLQTTGGIGY